MKKLFLFSLFLLMFIMIPTVSAQDLTVPVIVMENNEGHEIHLEGSLHFGTPQFFDNMVAYAESVGTTILHPNMITNYRFILTYKMIAHLFGLPSEGDFLGVYYGTGKWVLCDLSVDRMNELLNKNDQDEQNNTLLNMVLDPDNRFLYQKMIIEKINSVTEGPAEMIVFHRALEMYKTAIGLKECVIITGAAQIPLLLQWFKASGYTIIGYEEKNPLAGT